MVNEERLTELKNKRLQLKEEIEKVDIEIAGIIAPWPEFRVVTIMIGSERREEGRYSIDAPVEMVDKIEMVERNEDDLIIFKDGESMPLKEYFTSKQIESIV